MSSRPAFDPSLADITDLVDESVVVFGFDFRVKVWNAEAERLYEWNRDEIIGNVIQAAVKCSPSEPLKVIVAKVRETGVWRGEFSRKTKHGKTVTVRAKWSLRRDPNGDFLDIVETSQDITEMRRTEEALERVGFQYQNLFHASAASFWELEFSAVTLLLRELRENGVRDYRSYFDEHPEFVRQMIRATRILDVNEKSLAMFGDGDRDTLMKSLDPFWPDESLGVFAESVLASIEGKPHYSAETRFLSLNGRNFDTLFTVSYPPELMRSSRFLVGIIDLTEAKKAKSDQAASERRYQDFFHFLPIGMLRLDGRALVEIFKAARAEGVVDFAGYLKERPDICEKALNGLRIVEVNRRTIEILRGKSAKEFHVSVARYWTESVNFFREVMGARYAGKPTVEGLTKLICHDGTIIDTLFFAAYGPVTGDETVSVVGLIDVSDRVKAQEMLAQVQAEMAHAVRVSVLGELAASIAHEVSQPLTAIESNTEASLTWLRHSPPNIDEVRALSTQTALEVQRAADIIHRIRSMAVRADPDHANLDLNAVVREAFLFLRHELQRNDIDVVLDLGEDLPAVLGDRVQLQQVIVNLAVNAMQAMVLADSKPRQILLTTRRVDHEAVAIDIRDTGPGISDDVLPRLFESFFSTKSTGMGMGLPICRSIIEAHGGTISAANWDDGQGARFIVTLSTPAASTN
jgi:PAS domain S-box-containing protein